MDAQAQQNSNHSPRARCGKRVAVPAILAFVLASCGGGSGGSDDDGGEPGGNVTVTAVVLSFPTGATPPGFLNDAYNTGAAVEIVEEDGVTPVTTATVLVNGAALTYFPENGDYEGQLNINPGAKVTVKVRVGGQNFSVSHAQFSTYPTIVAPSAGTTWSSLNSNIVRWSGAAETSTSRYAVGIFGLEGQHLWPIGGGFRDLDNTRSSLEIAGHELTRGDQFVLVGILDGERISGAERGSGLVIGGFNYSPIEVTTQADILAGIETVPATSTLGVNTSRSLAATGTFQDGSERDVTTQVNWSSSDESTVAVDSTGLVTGIHTGQATITAELEGFQAESVVSVFQPNPSPPPPLSQSVTYQIDYAHSGRATFGSDGPSFPPNARWSTTLNGTISYPLIAEGRVFVTTNLDSFGGTNGISLYALDLATGVVLWGPVTYPGFFWSGLAYDHGKVFVINGDGLLSSFDAATGAPGWSTQLYDSNSYSAPPIAVNGVVYIDGGGRVTAIDEENGEELWFAPESDGGQSSPTFSGDGIFASYACQVFKFDPYSGATLWHYNGGCFGSGKTSVYSNGELFVRASSVVPRNPIFNADTGAITGSSRATRAPAFSQATGFHLENGSLRAIDQAERNELWTFAGDGRLITAPIVIDDIVVIGSSRGNIYALDGVEGTVLWSDSTGANIEDPDEFTIRRPLIGLGAGEGYLVVPASNVLTAWRLVP